MIVVQNEASLGLYKVYLLTMELRALLDLKADGFKFKPKILLPVVSPCSGGLISLRMGLFSVKQCQ